MNLNKFKNINIIPVLESLTLLDISDEEYFGEKYKDYISNSKLKLINPDEGGSPELYKKGLPFSVSDSFLLGSCVHTNILQPNEFKVVYNVDRPTAKAGFMADELYFLFKDKGFVSYDDALAASNKIDYYKNKFDEVKFKSLIEKCNSYFIKRKNYEENNLDNCEIFYVDDKLGNKFEGCSKQLQTDKNIQKLLHPEGILCPVESLNEATILLNIQCSFPDNYSVILKLKGKLDNFTIDTDLNLITLNDLKTTGHLIENFGKESFYKYHYYRQMYMYLWMLSLLNEKLYKLKNPSFKCNMLLVSTIPNYNTGVFPVNYKHLMKGKEEFKDLIRRIAYLERYGTIDS